MVAMAEREIASIVWHQVGHHIDVIYAEGEPDNIIGALVVAAQLAESVGLAPVPAPPGTIRWTRHPEPGNPDLARDGGGGPRRAGDSSCPRR